MRKMDKIVIWPVYFDSTKSRSEGRRVPKNLAIPEPDVKTVQKAVEHVALEAEVIPDIKHPRMSWRKSGALIVSKKDSKNRIIKNIAEELTNSNVKK